MDSHIAGKTMTDFSELIRDSMLLIKMRYKEPESRARIFVALLTVLECQLDVLGEEWLSVYGEMQKIGIPIEMKEKIDALADLTKRLRKLEEDKGDN